jgi:hypothetical protein
LFAQVAPWSNMSHELAADSAIPATRSRARELVEEVVHRLMACVLSGHVAVREREIVVLLATDELPRDIAA